jgi:hypothetical protein
VAPKATVQMATRTAMTGVENFMMMLVVEETLQLFELVQGE